MFDDLFVMTISKVGRMNTICLLSFLFLSFFGFLFAQEECPNLAPTGSQTSFPAPPTPVKYSACRCVSGNQILKCACDEHSLDHFNNKLLHERLASVLRRPYFRYFKVNLDRECPFWNSNDQCSIRDCSVETCMPDELPISFRNEANPERRDQVAEACAQEEKLSSVDASLNAQQRKDIAAWDPRAAEKDYCIIDDDGTTECSYIDLLKNPERYTGYAGPSAIRVWRAIYEENCFKPSKESPLMNLAKSMEIEECQEKKAFFQVISGLHSSINIHLCYKFLHALGHWGPNLQEFVKRFDDDFTNGEGSQRLSNLYFTYSIMLRAVKKASKLFREEDFYTGMLDEDEDARNAVHEILDLEESFPHAFDEARLFCGEPLEAARLKEEFRLHFLNISRIMDCVGCQKCRLWGKLQTQGIGTALKILFSAQEEVDSFKLKRTEIVALWNVLGRLSSSVKHVDEFRVLLDSQGDVVPVKTEKVDPSYSSLFQKSRSEL